MFEKKIVKEIIDWIKVLCWALVLSFLITKFAFANSVVPTGSMLPTIQINDHILVNKLPMYYRDPERGEIVVFHGEDDKDLVKRVIGLPGDVVDIKEGKVYINGEVLDESYLPDGTITEPKSYMEYPLTLGENEYFVMGDNRGNSEDSRYIGPIERERIFAVAKIRIYPFNAIGFLK